MKSIALLPTQPYLYIGACTINSYYKNYFSKVLYGDEATPENSYNLALNSDIITILGHGVPCEVTLQNEEDFISYKGMTNKSLPSGKRICYEDKNLDLLPNKYLDVISCSTADGLGKLAIESGAKAYLGSREDFLFIIGDCKPENMSFFIAEGEAIPYLVNGNPYKAQESRINKYNELIEYYETLGGIYNYISIILEYDKEISVLLTRDSITI
jgi:hypothetical protein